MVFFRRGGRAFFMYGFAKSRKANIDADEVQQFKEAAMHVLSFDRQATHGTDGKRRFCGGEVE